LTVFSGMANPGESPRGEPWLAIRLPALSLAPPIIATMRPLSATLRWHKTP
jgi:hypothetical protein